MNVDVVESDGIEQELEPQIQSLIDSLIKKVCEREGAGICLGRSAIVRTTQVSEAVNSYLIEGELHRGKDQFDFRVYAVDAGQDEVVGVMATVEIGFFPRTYIQLHDKESWKWVRV